MAILYVYYPLLLFSFLSPADKWRSGPLCVRRELGYLPEWVE